MFCTDMRLESIHSIPPMWVLGFSHAKFSMGMSSNAPFWPSIRCTPTANLKLFLERLLRTWSFLEMKLWSWPRFYWTLKVTRYSPFNPPMLQVFFSVSRDNAMSIGRDNDSIGYVNQHGLSRKVKRDALLHWASLHSLWLNSISSNL